MSAKAAEIESQPDSMVVGESFGGSVLEHLVSQTAEQRHRDHLRLYTLKFKASKKCQRTACPASRVVPVICEIQKSRTHTRVAERPTGRHSQSEHHRPTRTKNL